MAEKKKSTTKPATKKTVAVEAKPKKESVSKEVCKDYTLTLNKILLCVYVIIALLVVNITLLVVFNGNKETSNTAAAEEASGEYDVSMFTAITTENIDKAVASNEEKLVYIGRSSCSFCVKFLPVLQQAQKDYDYETLYLDITTVTSEEQKNILLSYDDDEKFISENFGATPMVLLMKNGKMIDHWIGYAEYDKYVEWLEKNGFEAK